MATYTFNFELPDDLIDDLGSTDVPAAKAREAFVMELVREERISRGKAAEILGISHWDLPDLILEYRIPSGPRTAEEFRQEVETAHRLLEEARTVGRNQQQ